MDSRLMALRRRVRGALRVLAAPRGWQQARLVEHCEQAATGARLLAFDGAMPLGMCEASIGIDPPRAGPPALATLYFDDGQGFRDELSARVLVGSAAPLEQRVLIPMTTRRLAIASDADLQRRPESRSESQSDPGRLASPQGLFLRFKAVGLPRTAAWASAGRLRRRAGRPAALGLRALAAAFPDEASSERLRRTHYRHYVAQLEQRLLAARAAIDRDAATLSGPALLSVLWVVREREALQHAALLESLVAQRLASWQLVIADATAEGLREAAANLPERCCVVRVAAACAEATARNAALARGHGEFVVALSAGDRLHELAVYLLAAALRRAPGAVAIYTDDDRMDGDGERSAPAFRAAFAPEQLHALEAIGPLCALRRECVLAAGGFHAGYDEVEDFELRARILGALPWRAGLVEHVPFIALHRSGDARPRSVASLRAASERGRVALQRSALGREALVLKTAIAGVYRLQEPLPNPLPLASIIVPTRDGYRHLRTCVESVLVHSDYRAFELLVVDNQSRDPATLRYLQQLSGTQKVRVLRYDAPFNYSAINNFAVGQAAGEVVILLNDDTRVLSPGWLRELMSLARRPDIGAVGAKLFYPDGTIQHAGVGLGIGIGAVAGHLGLFNPGRADGYLHRFRLRRTLSAVTAACMAVEKRKYLAVAGLDQTNLTVAFNDIDFCLRLAERGWRCVWTPHAELLHYESKSRGLDDSPGKRERFAAEVQTMRERWGERLAQDPFEPRQLFPMLNDMAFAGDTNAHEPWRE